MKKFSVLVVLFMLASNASAADNRGVAVKGTAAPTAPAKELRTALVIGNSTYLSSPLKNPANDARVMAKALRDLGFAVDERTNLSQGQMKQAIEDFGRNIRAGGVGLFYYAGHGMQVNGRNYLIPVDADIQGEAEVDYKAVDAGLVTAKMELARNNMNIVILDACRNNPFSRSFRAANQGLASMLAPSGTFIAYATAPGSVASDGTGQNGLYTEQLVNNMKKTGLRIEDVFKQVRSGVQGQTQGKQVPWESSSLVGDFYFSGKPPADGIDRSKLEGLAEGSKERQAELERLQKLEAEAAAQMAKEQAEISKKEKEFAALDAQIASMKSRLGSGAAGADDSLEKMVAMVKQKETDARQIEQLKQQREAEERKRQAEINKLKRESDRRKRAAIEKDIAAYNEIANSEYGKDMIPAAWKSLVNKYPEGRTVAQGDVADFRKAFALPEADYTDPVTGMQFVLVNGGCYQMGSTSGGGEEQPLHEVCVDDFYIGKFEVTQAQWRAVTGKNPSHFSSCGDTCPVEQVSWDDAREFINKLNQRTNKTFRLPTEAEWEYAARSEGKNEAWAGTNDEASLGEYAWYEPNSGKRTHPVGRKRPNSIGIHDMSGNVWEWCQDWYYKNSPKNDPQGPSSGSIRVLRGGSWHNDANGTRSTHRDGAYPDGRSRDLGFRLARTK